MNRIFSALAFLNIGVAILALVQVAKFGLENEKCVQYMNECLQGIIGFSLYLVFVLLPLLSLLLVFRKKNSQGEHIGYVVGAALLGIILLGVFGFGIFSTWGVSDIERHSRVVEIMTPFFFIVFFSYILSIVISVIFKLKKYMTIK